MGRSTTFVATYGAELSIGVANTTDEPDVAYSSLGSTLTVFISVTSKDKFVFVSLKWSDIESL